MTPNTNSDAAEQWLDHAEKTIPEIAKASEGAEWEREFDEMFRWTDFAGAIGGHVLVKRDSAYAIEETERSELKAFIAHQRQQAVAEFAREVVAAGKMLGGKKSHHWYRGFRMILEWRGINLD